MRKEYHRCDLGLGLRGKYFAAYTQAIKNLRSLRRVGFARVAKP